MTVRSLIARCNNIHADTELIIYMNRDNWMTATWSFMGPMKKLTYNWEQYEIDLFWLSTNAEGITQVVIVLKE